LVGAHRQLLVDLGVGRQVGQPPRQLAVLLPQHLQLVAGQRGGASVLARHHQALRQVGELLEEIRVPAQPGSHLVRAEFLLGLAHACHSPSNTNAAGPAMMIGASSAAQPMRRSPPGNDTVACRAMRPRRTSAATAAQAPLPQARVSPTPRSYTRRRTWSGASTWAKPTLTDCGNAGEACRAAPSPATSAVPTSPTSITACGLPIDTAPNTTRRPSSSSAYSAASASNPASGTAAGAKRGAPMSTA